jgi:5'-nucleotidase
MRPLLLITNDDGFFAEGIQALAAGLRGLAEIFIVAPDREKSATSLSLTLRRPLRVEKIKRNVHAVDGTPADCIYLAIKKLLPRRPRLILSGINRGPNLGQQDISYSGTVAAALQGTFLQIPSIAISLLPDREGKFDFLPAAKYVRGVAVRILEAGLPPGLTLNINIPPCPVKGTRITTLGEKRYDPAVIEKEDPRGKTYYWIGLGKIEPLGGWRSDIRAVEAGFISVTPLHTDRTDYKSLSLSALREIFQGLA